jgi:hypothetical protein
MVVSCDAVLKTKERGVSLSRSNKGMMCIRGFVALLLVLALVTIAHSGHEAPIYPSFYPQEIDIAALAPERAAQLLAENKLQAYVGEPRFAGPFPDTLHAIGSLGSFVLLRINPMSALAKDEASTCALAGAVAAGMAGKANFVIHPYPVTPFHGDYLHYADLATAARARVLAAALPAGSGFKVKLSAVATDLVRAEWLSNSDWDVSVETVSVDELLAAATRTLNGWIGPPWLRTGWFSAVLLLADGIEPAQRRRVETDIRQLEAGGDDVDHINLERDLVSLLAGSCHTMVAGYMVKREYVNVEYSNGIENIGYDALSGLNSSMFLRTVKLKDFPWNGWLALGIDGKPDAAWNPVAGFSDRYGRLVWSALSDSALMPTPYDAGWMLNRASDVQSTPSP